MTDDRFDTTWDQLAELGKCDGRGGAEYRRVRREWQLFAKAGITGDLAESIERRANLSPFQNCTTSLLSKMKGPR